MLFTCPWIWSNLTNNVQINGQFEDCTKEVLPGVETENSSDKEDRNITTEKLKMIVINVCDGDKVAILIINIEWVT